MDQIHRHFPSPFGDDRKIITIVYPDPDNDRAALINVDGVFQCSAEYDRRSGSFKFGKSRKNRLSDMDLNSITDLFDKYKMHDGTRWLRISQPLFSANMHDKITELITAAKTHAVSFADVIKFIDQHYDYMPTAFKNGKVYNRKATNQGSAKLFAFAQINGLSPEDTLYLFAEHYRFVLNYPKAPEHQNIREFMNHGFTGIIFEVNPLTAK